MSVQMRDYCEFVVINLLWGYPRSKVKIPPIPAPNPVLIHCLVLILSTWQTDYGLLNHFHPLSINCDLIRSYVTGYNVGTYILFFNASVS